MHMCNHGREDFSRKSMMEAAKTNGEQSSQFGMVNGVIERRCHAKQKLRELQVTTYH